MHDLGFSEEERGIIDGLLSKPHGIIFVTGPTGSGKTTTLYSCLSLLNRGKAKIVTIEDPVEYQIKGIVQTQTHAAIGLNFASALRAMLRHDPDVIMVGEVRDVETARISIQSALTGHLVLSTLHTNDAASSITRLIDMSIEPYLIASSVECFIAQRLIRLLCPQCKVPTQIDAQTASMFGVDNVGADVVIYESKGCPGCRMTGYSGRGVIAEILMMDEGIRDLIIKKATASQIKDAAIHKGMNTLRVAGWKKIIKGLTSPSEVLRVTHTDY